MAIGLGLSMIGFGAGSSAGGGGGAPLLLDGGLTAAPVAAYSTRKLRTAYAGPCMKVRRASDNTTQDIGFSAGSLDTTALLAFVGAGDGFIDTWYDQQNSNDLAQATAGLQPLIVSSGSVIVKNSKPCPCFLQGVQPCELEKAGVTALAGAAAFTASAVIEDDASGSRGIWLKSTTTDEYSGPSALTMYLNGSGNILGYQSGAKSSKPFTANQMSTALSVWDGSDNTLYVDGSAGSTVSYGFALDATSSTIGYGFASGSPAIRYCSEILVWAVGLGGGDRSTLQADQKTFWGTP